MQMTEKPPPLWERMRTLAAEGDISPEQESDLREKADKFEAATNGFYASPQTCTVQQFLGAFARARRLWCDITGEPLV